MTDIVFLAVAEAHAAIDRCKFVIADDPEDPGQRDAGREIVHCFLGGLGADWDAVNAKVLCSIADRIFWGSSMFGTCLCVMATESHFGAPARTRTYCFDTVRPE